MTTFLIDGKYMSAQQAVDHLQRRVQSLEGQLAAMDSLRKPVQAYDINDRESRIANARAFGQSEAARKAEIERLKKPAA